MINTQNQFANALVNNHHNEYVSELISSEDIFKSISNDIIDMLEGYYAKKYNIDFSELINVLKEYRLNKSKTYIKRIEIDSIREYLLKKIEE